MTITQFLELIWIIGVFLVLTALVVIEVINVRRDEAIEVVESGGELIDLSTVDFDFRVLESSEPALLPALKGNQITQRRVK